MPYALLLFLSWLFETFTAPTAASPSQLQAILTPVLNGSGLAPYLGHYLCRRPIYFRFKPSSAYGATALRGAQHLVLRVQNCPTLVYNTMLDERRNPVVTIQVLKLAPDSARIRIDLPIEGVTGHFTLLKVNAWFIQKEEVFEK